MPAHNFIDLTGKRFGKLTVECISHKNYRDLLFWRCKCDCGKSMVTTTHHLKSGHTKSCGCGRIESITSHGQSKTRLYKVWAAMIGRCYGSHSSSERYRDRGITVCDRWRESYENFIADMGLPPTDSHSVDRIDNDGNYEPGNCRWATRFEQARNTRRTLWVEHNGERKSMAEWCAIVGIKKATVLSRKHKGMSVHDAIFTPVAHNPRWHGEKPT